MSTRHMLKYHLAIPAAIFGVLLVVGVPVGTAFVIGMMSGCVSMMMGGIGRAQNRDRSDGIRTRGDRPSPR